METIVTTAICTAFAGVGLAFREWLRLSTVREKQAAISVLSDVIVGVVLVGFVAGVWFVVSPAAAVATFLVPAVLVVGKHIAAFAQHVLYFWWERRLRVGVQGHVDATVPAEEKHRQRDGDEYGAENL